MTNSKIAYIDQEEKFLIESIENNIHLPKSMISETRKTLEDMAKQYNEKKKINISLYNRDILSIKQKAREYGIPYQTLVSMLIRQFANDKLKIELS